MALENNAGNRKRSVHLTDLAITLVVLLGCAFFYWETTKFEEVSSLLGDNMPPQAFPRLILGVIAVLVIILPFEHLFNRSGIGKLDEGRQSGIELMTIISALLLIFVVISIDWLGTLGSMILVALALPILWGERRWYLLVPFALIFPGLVTLLFAYVLGVHFEPGAIGLSVK